MVVHLSSVYDDARNDTDGLLFLCVLMDRQTSNKQGGGFDFTRGEGKKEETKPVYIVRFMNGGLYARSCFLPIKVCREGATISSTDVHTTTYIFSRKTILLRVFESGNHS